MSLLMTAEQGWIISHLHYLNKIYNTVDNGDQTSKLEFNSNLFIINSTFLRKNQISNLNESESVKNKKIRKKLILTIPSPKLDEIKFVRCTLKKMLYKAAEKNLFTKEVVNDNNKEAREASCQFYDTPYDVSSQLYGSNERDKSVITKINFIEYVFPEKCCFYSYDVKNIHKKLELANQFDFILMDPPWWNKFIRRNKKQNYKMIYNEVLCAIPISRLLSFNGLIALWCTNADSHLKFILNVIFPKWGIKFIGKWYWVKITQSGNTICDFNDKLGKQPYELLIFGTFLESHAKIPDKMLLVSVPSAIHSHKPPILDVMKSYLPSNPNCLEIFARYLLPHWTSWGLEVLKLQQLSLYTIK